MDPTQLESYNVVFLDFDGVIKESVDVKGFAFEQLFSPYGGDIAKRVRVHHEANSGVSRYDKLPLYLEWADIRVDDETVEEFATRFSSMAKQGVIGSPWVSGMPDYLVNNLNQKTFFIITATPQKEIEDILHVLNLRHCIKEAIGSPTGKTMAVASIMRKYNIKPDSAVMVGDSSSDQQAATENGIMFILRKTNLNRHLQKKCHNAMIKDFHNG